MAGMGDILKKVRNCGLEENTLIFFFSDNGEPTAKTVPYASTNIFPVDFAAILFPVAVNAARAEVALLLSR
jgi:arylsulfatase A-like enzyme